MVADKGIWASARFLVDVLGDHAVHFAQAHAITLGRKGDLAGVDVWSMIAAAAHHLTRRTPDEGELLH
jgi:hypothetical protein